MKKISVFILSLSLFTLLSASMSFAGTRVTFDKDGNEIETQDNRFDGTIYEFPNGIVKIEKRNAYGTYTVIEYPDGSKHTKEPTSYGYTLERMKHVDDTDVSIKHVIYQTNPDRSLITLMTTPIKNDAGEDIYHSDDGISYRKVTVGEYGLYKFVQIDPSPATNASGAGSAAAETPPAAAAGAGTDTKTPVSTGDSAPATAAAAAGPAKEKK